MEKSKILTEYSREALIDAVHENWWDWVRLCADTPYYSFEETSEYSIMYFQSNGKSDMGWCVRINTSPDRCEATIDDVCSSFEENGLPVSIMYTPKSGPDMLETHLKARGLTRVIGNPAMAADLLELKQDRPLPEGFSIKRIVDDSGMDQFREIFWEGYEANRGWIDYNVNSAKMLGYDPDCIIRSYLGSLDDEPIATSQVVFSGGVVGLFSTVVATEHRRKGFGTAMTLESLRLGIPEGYRFGVLWATDMGINVYRRIGFEVLFPIILYLETGEH
jgi:GNAT superfamily N-acetyltransferase